MKTLALCVALTLPLGACHREAATPTAEAGPAATASTSVVGAWQLVKLDCYCPAGTPVPNQRLTLDSTRQFQYFTNGQLLATGSYTLGTGSPCGGGPSAAPLLSVTLATPNSYAPHGNYTLRGDTLIIDQCLAADGPRYTFRRQR